jgi:uncharacterized protein
MVNFNGKGLDMEKEMYNIEDAWTNTFTGRVARPLEPNRTNYCIEDIAHSLSLQCRWNGHSKSFYSVAQHSVYASDFVRIKGESKPTVDRDYRFAALMHDASEAYLCDVPRPIKGHLGNYKELEAKTELAIQNRFGIIVNPHVLDAVKLVDNELLVRERNALIVKAPNMIWGFETFDDSYIQTMLEDIECWSPEKAEIEFLDTFKELQN